MALAGWHDGRTAIIFLLAAVAVTRPGNTVAFAADGSVHDLTEATFDAAIQGQQLVFVSFYAPWCLHSISLAPEWEGLAVLSKELGVPVAKVDSIAHRKLADRHNVQFYPTLLLYKGSPNASKPYRGDRTAKQMAEWLAVWRKSDLVERPARSAPALRQWIGKRPFAVLGLLTGEAIGDTAVRAALQVASFVLNPGDPGGEVPVGEATGPVGQALLAEAGLLDQQLPCILAVRDFDFEERILTFRPDDGIWEGSVEQLIWWLRVTRIPTLIPASSDTEAFFLHDIDPGAGLVIYFGSDEKLRRDLHQLAAAAAAARFPATAIAPAAERRGRLKWVHATGDDFGMRLGKSVSLSAADFPEVVLWEFGETEEQDTTYRLSQHEKGAGTLSKASVAAFVASWQTGALAAEKDPVLAVTSETFEAEVLGSSRDVLVMFYAPWCGHCQALEPEYRLLAQHYAADKGILIAKMDATAHRHHTVQVESFPTLKLYQRGRMGPIDAGLATGRKVKSLIDFVEVHRTANHRGGKGKSVTKLAGVAAGSVEVAQAAGKGEVAGAEEARRQQMVSSTSGVWIFDDMSDPDRRGVQLSADMARSRSGFTLVQAGELGVLLTPGDYGGARAVRHFSSEEEATSYVASSKSRSAAAGNRGPPASAGAARRLPCPADASAAGCVAWCEAVVGPLQAAASVRARLSGGPCAELAGQSVAKLPRCECFDSAGLLLQAMCVSPCHAVPRAPSSASCERVAAGSGSDADPVKQRRYLLYDTKYGEGFNLQREVYPRAGWVVAELNKEAEQLCREQSSSPCVEWVLVLPPWCRLVHWWSGPEPLPWSTFFDPAALRSAAVPVLEFDEYVAAVGAARVDLAVIYQTDKLQEAVVAQLRGGRGQFLGWTSDLQLCAEEYREVPEQTRLPGGELEMTYAGHCEGGIRAAATQCACLDGPWPRAVVDALQSLESSVVSVLLKGYDYLLAPDNEELDALSLRESMFFSEEIRRHGDDFIAAALQGRPYLAAHCRRTDFLRVHAETTPSADAIAMTINKALEETSMRQVFIATDAPSDLRDSLRQEVKGTVHFYDEASGARALGHPGKHAAAEIWIAARANYFIGTHDSRFTMSIQVERGFLGKPKATTVQEFCKSYKAGAKRCTAAHYRHIGRKGKHRDRYA